MHALSLKTFVKFFKSPSSCYLRPIYLVTPSAIARKKATMQQLLGDILACFAC